MEKRGNLGAPMDLFLQRPSQTLSPDSQNTMLDLVASEAAGKKKTLKQAAPTNRMFLMDFFDDRVRVLIQDQINNKWEKPGTVISSCPTHTDQGAWSHWVKTDDGKTYTWNTRFLTREPESDTQAEEEQASQE